MKRTIIWPAVSSAVLSAISILTVNWNSDFALVTGLAGIASAILATHE